MSSCVVVDEVFGEDLLVALDEDDREDGDAGPTKPDSSGIVFLSRLKFHVRFL